MKCNIIILFEKKRTRQLNICLDNLPTEMNCYMVSSFHEGIYQVMRYNYDLIIISVLKSMEFTEQAIEGIRRLKKLLSLHSFLIQWSGRNSVSGLGQIKCYGKQMTIGNWNWQFVLWFAGIGGTPMNRVNIGLCRKAHSF